MPIEVCTPGLWSKAALVYLEEALIQGGTDVIPYVDAALACLKIEAGEQPADLDLLAEAGIPDDEQPGDGQDGGSANE